MGITAGGITLVLGGARSGKSEHGERLAEAAARAGTLNGATSPNSPVSAPVVTYVATGPAPSADDPEWAARVEAHRTRRPAHWFTIEVVPIGDTSAVGSGEDSSVPAGQWDPATSVDLAVPVDLTVLAVDDPVVQSLLTAQGAVLVDSLGTWVAGDRDFTVDVDGLCRALLQRKRQGHPTVLVSDEVGLGVHPDSDIGRRFIDALGRVNRKVGEVADTVHLVVAGRVMELTGRMGDSDIGSSGALPVRDPSPDVVSQNRYAGAP